MSYFVELAGIVPILTPRPLAARLLPPNFICLMCESDQLSNTVDLQLLLVRMVIKSYTKPHKRNMNPKLPMNRGAVHTNKKAQGCRCPSGIPCATVKTNLQNFSFAQDNPYVVSFFFVKFFKEILYFCVIRHIPRNGFAGLYQMNLNA